MLSKIIFEAQNLFLLLMILIHSIEEVQIF